MPALRSDEALSFEPMERRIERPGFELQHAFDHCSKRSVIPQPCIGSSCNVLRTSMSSVPCGTSLLSLVTGVPSTGEKT